TAADAGCAGEPRTSLRSAGTCTPPSDAAPASLAGPVPVHHLAHHRPLAVTKGKKNHSRKKNLIRPPEEQPPNKMSVSYPPENDGFLLAAHTGGKRYLNDVSNGFSCMTPRSCLKYTLRVTFVWAEITFKATVSPRSRRMKIA